MTTETAKGPGTSALSAVGSAGFDFGSLIRRPETGAFLGLVFVFVFFIIFGNENFVRPAGAASYLNVAANFMKGEKTRDEITDLMAGGEALANLGADVESYMETHEGHPPPAQH